MFFSLLALVQREKPFPCQLAEVEQTNEVNRASCKLAMPQGQAQRESAGDRPRPCSALVVGLVMLATCEDMQTLQMVGGKRGVVGHGLVRQQHTKMHRLGRLPTGETLKSR